MDKGEVIWCTSGCFRYCHEGHADLLEWIKKLKGKDEKVWIGINSDEYLKDKGKAGESAEERCNNVETLAKAIFSEEDLFVCIEDDILSLCRSYFKQPIRIVWILGEDYLDKDFKERDQADLILFTPRLGISSSLIDQEKVNDDKLLLPSIRDPARNVLSGDPEGLPTTDRDNNTGVDIDSSSSGTKSQCDYL